MSRADKLKEKIGWYKVVFVTLMAVVISLAGWLANYINDPQKLPWVTLAIITIVLSIIGIALVNRAAYKAMDELEKEP